MYLSSYLQNTICQHGMKTPQFYIIIEFPDHKAWEKYGYSIFGSQRHGAS
jgi:hypothetical protein